MTKKIENTFAKALEQVEALQKVFRQNGKLESAMMESKTDISSLAEINSAFETLKQALTTSTTLTEGVLDADDEDGFMARSQLYFMAQDAIKLHGMIDDKENLEPWVQSKIAQAAQSIDAVRRYTEYNAMNDSMPMEDTSLSEEQIDEGKVATWALALLLGLGSYAGLEATSAKHTPLGQALEYAAEQGDEEAAKLYKNIDAYVDNDPQSLVNWRMNNEKIFDRFDESASLMEDGPNPLMRFLAPFVSGAGSDVYDQPHAGAWDSHSHDDEHADKPAEFMATRNTAADSVLKSLQKATPEKRYNIYQEILKNLTKPGGFVYEDEALMEHPLAKIIKNLMKKGDELGNKISDEDLAAATATAATLGGLGAATRPRKTDAETPDEFMRKRVGEGDYGKKKKKKKKKYYGESYQDRYNRVKATANDIKVNRELATMPQDAARKVSGDADYSHDSNPAYAAKKAARKDGIPHKDIVTRMKPNPTDGKFKWGRDQLTDDVASYEDQYDDRIQVTVEKDKLLYNGNPIQNYDWNSSAKDMVNPKFYARAKSWKEIHGYLVRFLGNEEGMKNAIRQVFNTNEGNITVSEGMEFDEKRNDDLQTVAKDLFANAKAAAKKKAK